MCGIQIKYTFGDKKEGEMAVLGEDGCVCVGGGGSLTANFPLVWLCLRDF